MKITILDEELEREYEEFVLGHREGVLYYSLKYRNLLTELLSCESMYLLALYQGRIKGILPLMRKNGRYGWVYNSLPFYGSYGGVIADEEEAYISLIDEYNNLIDSSDVGTATIVSNPLLIDNRSLPKHNEKDERIGQFTELLFNKSDLEKSLISNIDSSTRRNIKKAQRSGIKMEIDNEKIDFLKNIHYDNMNAIQGKPKPEEFFRLINIHFEKKDYSLYVASLDGKPIAALLLFYYNKAVEYFVPAIVNEFRTYQPLVLIIYHAMIDAAKRNYVLWNWGGTWLTQDGVYRFKKKWGGFERRYCYYIYIKNTKIYKASKEELLNEYSNFYVIPFNKLKNDK